MPEILDSQEAEIGGSQFEASMGKQFCETLSQKKVLQKKGLVAWLKV
jgi:hypothetical protein